MTKDDVPLPRLPKRKTDSHKGSFGRILIVGGSRGMAGAAVLAGRSALRGGAGLVRVATPHTAFQAVAAQLTCCLTASLDETRSGTIALRARTEIARLMDANDVLAIGPGIGRHRQTDFLIRTLVRNAPMPAVIDADGLNAVAASIEVLNHAQGPRILTPHPGEMARLAGLPSAAEVQKARRDVAQQFVARHPCVLVLKGHGTVVTDGDRLFVNRTGNPGMATAGSGDVLTGVIAALLAQGLEPYDAAVLGAHAHGLAGDLARDSLGETALIASDIVDMLPAAFKQLQQDT